MKSSYIVTLLCLLLVGLISCSGNKREEIKVKAKDAYEQKTSKNGDKDWGDVYKKMEELEAKKKEAQQALSKKSGMISESKPQNNEDSSVGENEDGNVLERTNEAPDEAVDPPEEVEENFIDSVNAVVDSIAELG